MPSSVVIALKSRGELHLCETKTYIQLKRIECLKGKKYLVENDVSVITLEI